MANIEDVEGFVSQDISSEINSVRAQISSRIEQSSAASSIFEYMDKYYKTLDSEQIDIPAEKAGIIANDGILAELAKSSKNEEGDVAGRTTDFATLYKKIQDLRKILNFKDNEKLALTGSMPTTNKTSDGRLDKTEAQVYGKCNHCGKDLEKPSKDGFCSKKCITAYNLETFKQKAADIRVSKEKTLEKVTAAVNLTNNFLGELGNMTAELSNLANSGFDERYMVYFKVGLTAVIEYLKRSINEMLIKKNDYIMMKVEKKKAFIKEADELGENSINGAFEKIEKALASAQKINDKMNEIYKKAYDAICSILPTKIEADSLSFGMTIRSNCYYPMKFAQKLENNNLDDSVGEVVDAEAILETIRNKFPFMHENEYAENPGVFNVKKIYSSYNGRAQKELIELLSDTWKKGAEPLPKYEKLKIPTWPPYLNIHWMIFLFTSWGPHGRNHYALPFMP